MKELFLAYLYKLRHDLTFRITLFIGGGLALLMTLLYFGISFLLETNMIDGPSMLISSLSPVQNFGLAVPINLITFTVLEFNQGGIRNKIIGGHSKPQIYASIFLNGLVFTFALMIIYALLTFGLGSAFGAIYSAIRPDDMAISAKYADYYLLKMIIIAIVSYISIVSFTVFFSTLFRNVGPTIPVVIIALLVCYLGGSLVSVIAQSEEGLLWAGRIIDPLYAFGANEYIDAQGFYASEEALDSMPIEALLSTGMSNETFVSGIISNLVYTAIFFGGGILIFSKRDIK